MTLLLGDCLSEMAKMDEASIDAIVTDPPYELGFMGKRWDSSGVAFQAATWAAALRALKPGGHLLAFGGTRTYHRMVCAIEDAGFEIRDSLHWIYGTGFPKSLNLEVETDGDGLRCVRQGRDVARAPGDKVCGNANRHHVGTALKPGHEPIVLARKPLIGTVAANVAAHGTGALNIDACRIALEDGASLARNNRDGENGWKNSSGGPNGAALRAAEGLAPLGRWPANVLLDEDAAAELDAQSGERTSGKPGTRRKPHSGTAHLGQMATQPVGERVESGYGDSGGASRFFYVAKPSRRERGDGNTHPTVKPVQLMRYLVRLVTPPGGLVLDPFAGSGTTGLACQAEGLRFIGIEREQAYMEIAQRRLAACPAI